MTKLDELKRNYGYQAKPVWPTCSTCIWFTSKITQLPVSIYDPNITWTKESELRCKLGGFKIGKSSTCDNHEKTTSKLEADTK